MQRIKEKLLRLNGKKGTNSFFIVVFVSVIKCYKRIFMVSFLSYDTETFMMSAL